jgi:hypothetical protein
MVLTFHDLEPIYISMIEINPYEITKFTETTLDKRTVIDDTQDI